MFVAIAIHHAAPEHRDAFIAFMHRVVAATAGAPGLIAFDACAEAGGSRLFGVSRWESAEAFEAALPTIMSLAPDRRAEWSLREDEVAPDEPGLIEVALSSPGALRPGRRSTAGAG